jgi:hypothetical protein
MLLDEINFTSSKDYIHMERFVNKGSPSGNTEKYNTSPDTRAKSDNESFYLSSVEFPEIINVEDFGEKPDFFKWQMLVHPDMIELSMFSVCQSKNKEALLVAPTASARTVKVLDSDGWFLKLNYKGLIGRLDRNVGRSQAISAIEVSKIIVNAIDTGKLPDKFFFLREQFARVIDLVDEEGKPYEWGIVLREPNVYPFKEEVKYLIPAFSLFAGDDKNPTHPTLLTQLIKRQSKSVEDFLFEDLIAPVFDCYFQLLINCGLQLECHAQNTMFAVDNDFKIIGIVAKDAESIDKDLSLMEDLKIKYKIQTLVYKCLRRTDYNYQIMHSFMFDFKLGEYLISPIIADAEKNFQFDIGNLLQRIKKHNHTFIQKLPSDFFPSHKWYDYSNEVHDRTKPRPYVAHYSTPFR